MTEPTLLSAVVVYDKPPHQTLRRWAVSGLLVAVAAAAFVAHDRLTDNPPAEQAQEAPVIRARPLDDGLKPRFGN